MQQKFSEVLSSEQTQAGTQRLKLQHQRRKKAANEILRKQKLERSQLIQQLNQFYTKSNMITFVQKKLKRYLQNEQNSINIKLLDLDFPFLHHSSFLSLQKDKNHNL